MAKQKAPVEFVLNSADPMSPPMIVMWACFKNGDLAGALDEFNRIAQDLLPDYEENPAPQAVITAALECAEEMEGAEDGEGE